VFESDVFDNLDPRLSNIDLIKENIKLVFRDKFIMKDTFNYTENNIDSILDKFIEKIL
jgi:hypothetical protein